MANDTYSVQTLIVENGKNVKGILVLSLDKYEFNGMQKPIDWEKASCKIGTSTVKTFIFSSEKPHVVICEGDNYGPAFVMNQAQADALVSKVSEFGILARDHRLAEEERIRHEEEERLRREEEERRREEEERRRREEEERRREEEERRRREEEERRRRELEERRRHEEEEERRRRKEEERKRREVLARKIENRKKRITEELSIAKENTIAVVISQSDDSSIKKAWSFISDNPYRILGVAVNATNEESNSALDKIKKLARLNALASYKGAVQLNGSDKPDRDLSIVQNALTLTKEMKYKWFWFADANASIAWQSERYRKELTLDGLEFGTYDLFLANFIYALIFDPTFKKGSLWRGIFTYYDYICNENSRELIKSRFNARELSELRILDALRNFKAEIFKPVEALCETDDVNRIVRLYKILKDVSSDNLGEFRKSVLSKLTKWFTSREEVVCALVDASDEDNIITRAEAREIKKVGNKYLREVDVVLENVLYAVKGENVRYEMIKESYRHATWQLMFAFNKAEQKDNAITCANKCYPYCTESDKRKIRNTFGFNAIKGGDRDATNAEWDIMGDNYYEGKNGYEQDYYEAFKWYKKAADAGNMYSQNSLGICYREGNGTYQSNYEAARWFECAFNNGNADGAFNLAQCYALGEGKLQDKSKAVELYLEAAKLGHPHAADVGKKLLDSMVAEQKMHRLTQHEHYDLGYQMPNGKTIVVEVELNYSANVYLMDNDDYRKYKECDNFSYYGGKATQSPYRIKIPHSGFWNLVIDNGDDDMTGIHTSVHTRTFNS